MASGRRRLPPDRAEAVELRLRARAGDLRPTEQLRFGATALGLCHGCSRIVYAGDSLAMAGAYLFHDECGPQATRPET